MRKLAGIGSSPARGWRNARKLLCVRLDSLGDVLMTSPAIRALKSSQSGRTVTLLASPTGAVAARLLPEIDRVIVFDAPWVKRESAVTDRRPSGLAMIERLQAERFDGAVIFTSYSQSPLPAAHLCYLAKIPLRLAYCRENPYQLLTHWERDPEPERFVRHEVRRQMDLVATTGATARDDRIRVRVDAKAVRRVQKILRARGIDPSDRWVVVHVGARAPSRRYPPTRFASVIHSLEQDVGWRTVMTGGSEEIELVESVRVAANANAVSLAGALAIEDVAALLSLAPVLISNNTGLVHIAAGVGTPIVDMYAQTNPQHGPWRVPSRVLFYDVPCRNCLKSICPEGHHRCLELVPPQAVVDAVRALTEDACGQRVAA